MTPTNASDTVNQSDTRSKKSSRLDSRLQDLVKDAALRTQSGEPLSDAVLASLNPHMTITGGMVAIDIGAEDPAATLAKLEALGLQHGATFGHTVSGLIPISVLNQLEAITDIRFARAALTMTHVGDVTNQADPALVADDARAQYNIDGTGVSIGVLSDSFDNLGGYADDIASGDLPSGIVVLEDLGKDGSDEGRAMLQIIHDIAPGANLLFHTAFLGAANFAQGIIDLANAGATVIVDDVAYLTQPFFQDGVIAQAADQVTAMGVAYFSSAGNSDDSSYEAAFDPSIVELGQTAHDFDPGAGVDTRLNFSLGTGDTIQLSFQWDQPYFSVSGGAGSVSDVDIFIVEAGTNNVIARGFDNNLGSDPVEFVEFTNETGSTQQYEIIINVFAGPNPGFMKFIDFAGDATWTDPWFVGAPTSFGHSNAEGTFAVGAARYTQTPEFGEDPPLIEPFSSLGGISILFDTAGNRLDTPEARNTVDFTAVDGGDTTFFGSDFEGNGFPNFFGTSASAPAAAAVAALLYQIAPNATRDQIEAALVESAIDMGDPGFDLLTGAGLIQATGAVFALLDLTENILVGGDGVDDFDGRAFDDTLEGRGADDILDGGDGIDTAIYSGNRSQYTITETGPGAFTISGPDGVDTLTNIEFAQFLDETVDLSDIGLPAIEGTPDPDILEGTAGPDRIFGLGDNDTLTGLAGNDILDGGLGDDAMTGGLGDDTYFFDSLNDTATELPGEGTDKVIASVKINTLLAGYENIEIFELSGAENTLLGNDTDTTLIANPNVGSKIFANGGVDTLQGSDFNDRLNGGSGDDTLFGAGGKDRLDGGLGADDMFGGTGDDRYFVDDLGDTVTELDGEGTDQVRASIDWTLGDFVENLRLRGSADSGVGNDLDNAIQAVASGSFLSGLGGNDNLRGSQGADTILGGNDNDTINGRSGDDDLRGGQGDDFIKGRSGEDTIRGDSGNDLLIGGNDNDWLSGGADQDELRGEGGADTFHFANGDFAGLTDAAADRITDFSQSDGDVIDLAMVDAIAGGADDAFTFIADTAFSGTAGELRFEQTAGNTMVFMDVDGDGTADYAIRLDGTINLAEADFVL